MGSKSHSLSRYALIADPGYFACFMALAPNALQSALSTPCCCLFEWFAWFAVATERLALLLGRKLWEVRSVHVHIWLTQELGYFPYIYIGFRCCMLLVGDAYWFADGGGIRGYSILLILQELMKTIERIERNYACEDSDEPAESSYHQGARWFIGNRLINSLNRFIEPFDELIWGFF